jgi:thymidylate kinase
MQKLHRELDRIEISKRDFFEKVRNGYLYLSKDKRFRKLDGTLPIHEVHQKIIKEIELLEKRQKK